MYSPQVSAIIFFSYVKESKNPAYPVITFSVVFKKTGLPAWNSTNYIIVTPNAESFPWTVTKFSLRLITRVKQNSSYLVSYVRSSDADASSSFSNHIIDA